MSENDPGMQIRAASAGDAAAIAEVLHTAFVEYEPLYTSGGFAATTPAAEQVTQRLSEGPIWVALQGPRVVGTISAVIKEQGCYVRGMAIVPTARGQHIGERLLEQVEQLALEQGAKRMYLSTTPFLDRAIRLYEYYGFQRSEEGPQALFGTPLFTMVKVLPARSQPSGGNSDS